MARQIRIRPEAPDAICRGQGNSDGRRRVRHRFLKRIMRVFFDTNVLVSAFTSRGLCSELFKGATVSCTLVVSVPLLAETRRILHEKFKVPREYVDEAIAIVEEDAVKAPAASPLEIAIKD